MPLTEEEKKEHRRISCQKFREANPDYQRQWAAKNKDKIKKYNAKPENVKARSKLSAKHRKLYRGKHKETQQSWRDRLCDGYVKGMLCRYSSLTFNNIPQSMVKAKRAEVQFQRLIKEQQNENEQTA